MSVEDSKKAVLFVMNCQRQVELASGFRRTLHAIHGFTIIQGSMMKIGFHFVRP
jgi:hypothetical protein